MTRLGRRPPAGLGHVGDRCVRADLHLAECILETRRTSWPTASTPDRRHVGEEFPFTMMVDPNDPTYLHGRRPQRPHDRAAQNLGGTCTGEHGVGIGKIKYLYASTARR